MNYEEFSDIETFKHSGKGTPLFMIGHKTAFTPKYMGSYLKFGFIQCPDTDQLP